MYTKHCVEDSVGVEQQAAQELELEQQGQKPNLGKEVNLTVEAAEE